MTVYLVQMVRKLAVDTDENPGLPPNATHEEVARYVADSFNASVFISNALRPDDFKITKT